MGEKIKVWVLRKYSDDVTDHRFLLVEIEVEETPKRIQLMSDQLGIVAGATWEKNGEFFVQKRYGPLVSRTRRGVLQVGLSLWTRERTKAQNALNEATQRVASLEKALAELGEEK